MLPVHRRVAEARRVGRAAAELLEEGRRRRVVDAPPGQARLDRRVLLRGRTPRRAEAVGRHDADVRAVPQGRRASRPPAGAPRPNFGRAVLTVTAVPAVPERATRARAVSSSRPMPAAVPRVAGERAVGLVCREARRQDLAGRLRRSGPRPRARPAPLGRARTRRPGGRPRLSNGRRVVLSETKKVAEERRARQLIRVPHGEPIEGGGVEGGGLARERHVEPALLHGRERFASSPMTVTRISSG